MFRLSRDPIQLPQLSADAAGGFASFEGKVRDHADGRAVRSLEYEAFDDMAEREGGRLVQEAIDRFGLLAAECVHRVGHLQIGETAVAITVAAPHRREAFAACEFIVDELKKRVPIWKKEHYAEGESEWVGTQPVASADLYRRQTILKEVGEEGQARLGQSRVLVVGAGGLGCPALMYLAAAGVGTVGICDRDSVDPTNLHRQILFGAPDIHKPKAAAAAATLSRLYPNIRFPVHPERIDASNARELLAGYDLVLDCTDSFHAKFLLNDQCVQLGKTLILASIHQFEGQIQATVPGEGPCLRCLYPEAPTEGCVGTCAESGVLGVTAGLLGVMQATEAIKNLLGMESPLFDQTLLVDLKDWTTLRIRRNRNAECPACGNGTMEKPLEIDWTQARSMENVVWLDIREPFEVLVNKGPKDIDWVRFPMSKYTGEAPEGVLMVVCAHGARSARMAADLRQRGREAYSVAGGMALAR